MPRSDQPHDLDSGPINADGLISILCDGVEVGRISEWIPSNRRHVPVVVELRHSVLEFAQGNTNGLAGTVTRMLIAPELLETGAFDNE